jgi:hypothetical protein
MSKSAPFYFKPLPEVKTGLQEKIHQAMRPSAKPKRGNLFHRTVIVKALSPVDVNYVPVSFVAKDWNVTSRRIRSLLAAGRLAGRREINGYWEVCYPYRFIIGTRGPVLKRQQKPKRGRLLSVVSAE